MLYIVQATRGAAVRYLGGSDRDLLVKSRTAAAAHPSRAQAEAEAAEAAADLPGFTFEVVEL